MVYDSLEPVEVSDPGADDIDETTERHLRELGYLR